MSMHERMGIQPFLDAVGEFIFVNEEPFQADIIFVPGNRSCEHALLAAKLYHQGYAPYVLPSGRYSINDGYFTGAAPQWREIYNGDYETEWHYLRDVLLREGVPDSAILKEDMATFTWDNAVKSRAVTDGMGLTVRKAIIACRSSHARRALFYYQTAYPDTEFRTCAASVPGLNKDDWFLSENGKEAVFSEIRMMGSQIRNEFDMLLEHSAPEKR